jgi:ABC-type xylose transport system permease subunit
MSLLSKDHRDFQDDGPRPKWTNRKGAPIMLSSAAAGVGVVIGFIIGWTTDLREAPVVLIAGLAGMLSFDFYWRWVKDSLPSSKHHQ